MKKSIIAVAFVAAVALTVFYAAPFQGSPQPLAHLFPAGPLLYLEAKDFRGELRDWNSSQEQQRWLASAEYESFQKSNLFLKLQAAGKEFAGAADFLPDSALVDSLAGGQSALAIYDIGNLEFLYITHIPTARVTTSALWQSSAKYETRRAGGVDFFVRVQSGRTVAFASTGDYLMLGTREEFVAGALRLLAGEALTPTSQEAWYAETTAAAGAAGDLRLVTNLDALLKTPQYRSYWIQRNSSEMRNYRSGIADLVRGGGEIHENRIFLRRTATQPVAGNADALVRLVPDSAEFYRSWAKPTAAQAVDLIEQRLLAPKVTPRSSFDYAPSVDAGNGETGGESDIETRIDEPPLAAQSAIVLDGLRRVLESVALEGALEIRPVEQAPDGVFSNMPSVIAISADAAWDGAAVRNALSATAASLWSASQSGAGWVTHQRGARTWYALDGLAPLEIAVEGNLLLLANSEQALGPVLDRIDLSPQTSDAASVAVFRHQAARDYYRKLMNLLDHTQPPGRPRFFSAQIWSLSGVFDRAGEMEVRTRDEGAALRESVIYRMR